MRKLIVCNLISLDGYYEGPGKNVMPMFAFGALYPEDNRFSQYNAERLRAADTLLLGRTSYDGFRSYWPSIQDDTNAPPLEQEISRLNNAIQKVVVSDSLTPDQTDPWSDTTRIIRRADAHTEIAELKQQTGKDILVFGSRILWNDLLAHGLVDELHLMIGPTIVGDGTLAFEGQTPKSMRLIETHGWDGSGLVLARYQVIV
jgi:dihydrofolate reductase